MVQGIGISAMILGAQGRLAESDAAIIRMQGSLDTGCLSTVPHDVRAFRCQKDKAFIGLEKARAEHFVNPPHLIHNRLYFGLHSDPRWHSLLARMNPPDAAADGAVAAGSHL